MFILDWMANVCPLWLLVYDHRYRVFIKVYGSLYMECVNTFYLCARRCLLTAGRSSSPRALISKRSKCCVMLGDRWLLAYSVHPRWVPWVNVTGRRIGRFKVRCGIERRENDLVGGDFVDTSQFPNCEWLDFHWPPSSGARAPLHRRRSGPFPRHVDINLISNTSSQPKF